MSWNRKSFLSFLSEAPEDIVSVTGKQGEKRDVKKPERPLKKLLDLKTKVAAKEAPVKVTQGKPEPFERPPVNVEKDFDDNQPALSARSRIKGLANEQLADIFKNNTFIRDRFDSNDAFADEFEADERFREHFRDLKGESSFSDKVTSLGKDKSFDSSRTFDLTDDDVFENYHKSIKRIMQDIENDDDIGGFMNSNLEKKAGELEYSDKMFKTGTNNYIHQIPDNVDLSDPEIRAIMEDVQTYQNIYNPNQDEEDEVSASELFKQFDFDNSGHVDFMKGLVNFDQSQDITDMLYGIGKDETWDMDTFKKFMKNHVNEGGIDDLRPLGQMLGSLMANTGNDSKVMGHMREFLETNDVNKFPKAQDLIDEFSPGDEFPEEYDSGEETEFQGYHSFLSSIRNRMEDEDGEVPEEVHRRLQSNLFGHFGPAMYNPQEGMAESLTDNGYIDFRDDFHRLMSSMLEGETDEDMYTDGEFGSWHENVEEFEDLIKDLGHSYLSDYEIENDGSNYWEGDYYDDDELISNSSLADIWSDASSFEELKDDFNDQMRDAVAGAEEEDERQRAEYSEEDVDGDGAVYDYNHPRNLWGAENPEDAPASSEKNAIQRLRDRAIGGLERGIRGVGGAAYQAVQNLPDEQRQRIMNDPRAQAAYNKANNANLRGVSFGGPDENEDPDSNERWEGSQTKNYQDDHTNYGLTFHRNPNNFQTHKIESLDDDLENAGLTRGDLKRAVYIAWNASPNQEMIASKAKEKFGVDFDENNPQHKAFAKRITAFNAIKNWKQNVLPSLNSGDILYNTPVGGSDGERALLYQKMGFGKDGEQGQQGVVGKDGKVYPLDPPGDRTMGQHRQARQVEVARRREQGQANAADARELSQRPIAPGPSEPFRQGEGPSEDQINRANAVRARWPSPAPTPAPAETQGPETFTTSNGVELPRRHQRQFEYLTRSTDYGFFARNLEASQSQNEPFNWFTNDDLPSQLDGNEESLGVARSLTRQVLGGNPDSDADRDEVKNVVRQILMNMRGTPIGQRNESYLYENADPSEVDFFSKEHPEMDIEEIKDILSVLLGNKPGVDKMTNIKDKAIQKLKKYFDHDD